MEQDKAVAGLLSLTGATGESKVLAYGRTEKIHPPTSNVLKYLPKGQRATWRRKLQAAYQQPTEPAARVALGRVRQELRLVNLSAVASLDEGFEETLTLHRLGVFPQLGMSLKTTNCLESVNALVEQRVGKVDRWRTSEQKHGGWPPPCSTSSRASGRSRATAPCCCSDRRCSGRSKAK